MLTNEKRAKIYTEAFEIQAGILPLASRYWLQQRLERAMNEAEDRGRQTLSPGSYSRTQLDCIYGVEDTGQ